MAQGQGQGSPGFGQVVSYWHPDLERAFRLAMVDAGDATMSGALREAAVLYIREHGGHVDDPSGRPRRRNGRSPSRRRRAGGTAVRHAVPDVDDGGGEPLYADGGPVPGTGHDGPGSGAAEAPGPGNDGGAGVPEGATDRIMEMLDGDIGNKDVAPRRGFGGIDPASVLGGS